MHNTKEEAIKYIAEMIWKFGETTFRGSGVVNPDQEIFKCITDDLSDQGETPITHYDRKWNVKGKSVTVNLYSADAYGAVQDEDLKYVETHNVQIDDWVE